MGVRDRGREPRHRRRTDPPLRPRRAQERGTAPEPRDVPQQDLRLRQRERIVELARPDGRYVPLCLLLYRGSWVRSPYDRVSANAPRELDVRLRATRRTDGRQAPGPLPEFCGHAHYSRRIARDGLHRRRNTLLEDSLVDDRGGGWIRRLQLTQ